MVDSTRRTFLTASICASLIPVALADQNPRIANWQLILPTQRKVAESESCATVGSWIHRLDSRNYHGRSDAIASRRAHFEARRSSLLTQITKARVSLETAQWDAALATMQAATGALITVVSVAAPGGYFMQGVLMGTGMLSDAGFSAIQLVRDEKVGEFLLGVTVESRLVTFGELIGQVTPSPWKRLLSKSLPVVVLTQQLYEAAKTTRDFLKIRGELDRHIGALNAVQEELQMLEHYGEQHYRATEQQLANLLRELLEDTMVNSSILPTAANKGCGTPPSPPSDLRVEKPS